MGKYADMIIDGLVDQYTGEVIDGDAPGFPRNKKRKKPRGGIGEERCERCGKRFKTQQGVSDHMADVHGGRLMHPYMFEPEYFGFRKMPVEFNDH